jgi:hypothetical protein
MGHTLKSRTEQGGQVRPSSTNFNCNPSGIPLLEPLDPEDFEEWVLWTDSVLSEFGLVYQISSSLGVIVIEIIRDVGEDGGIAAPYLYFVDAGEDDNDFIVNVAFLKISALPAHGNKLGPKVPRSGDLAIRTGRVLKLCSVHWAGCLNATSVWWLARPVICSPLCRER